VKTKVRITSLSCTNLVREPPFFDTLQVLVPSWNSSSVAAEATTRRVKKIFIMNEEGCLHLTIEVG
jgi:hypothetical protein